MRSAGLLVVAACASRGPPRPSMPPHSVPGVSISMYRGTSDRMLSVIDDRRWVTITGSSLVLDHVEPDAQLPTLTIESLVGHPLTVVRCVRERLAVPARPDGDGDGGGPDGEDGDGGDAGPPDRGLLERSDEVASEQEAGGPSSDVRCEVEGGTGARLLRVSYVTSSLAYRVQHDVTMTAADRALVMTRFAIATPAWGRHADVWLYEGEPGTGEAPRELARGSVALDGSTAILLAPEHEAPARLRRVFDGALHVPTAEDDDRARGQASVQAVWVWLELEDPALPLGPLHVHLALPGEAIRDLDVPAAGRAGSRRTRRFALWIDSQLRGVRRRATGASGPITVERFVVSVINTGEVPREVWVEERLRHAKHREVTNAWPAQPTVTGDRARTRLVIAPGSVERTGYEIVSSF